jgi:hypothetical protein
MARIFISYRRSDSQATAGRIYDRLTREFGGHDVFMDVDHIPPGVDFRAVRPVDTQITRHTTDPISRWLA